MTNTTSNTASKRKTEQTGSYDWTLILVVASLVTAGLVMVFSASYYQGMVGFENPYYFILKQVQWVVIGIVALVVAARIPYQIWERWSVLLMGLALLMLMAVIILGADLFGSTRTLFSGSVQPSEAAKVIVIIYISAWLTSKGDRIKDLNVGLIPFSVLLGLVAALVIAQPDISTAVLIVVTASVLFFIAGAELKQLLIIGILAGITLWIIITQSAYAGDRIDQYLISWENPLTSESWQIRHSTQAVVSGGPIGAGIGAGQMKTGAVPLSWSDNIFAVVGEETGLLGSLLLVVLFALFAYRGFQIALRARDNFGMLMATGITTLVMLQACLNVAVILALAPPTGVTLPFISYGGSSMAVLLGSVGLLLSVSKYGTAAQSGRRTVQRTASTKSGSSTMGEAAYARFDFGWRDRWARLSGSGRGGSTGTSRRNSRKPAKRTTRTSTTRGSRPSGRDSRR